MMTAPTAGFFAVTCESSNADVVRRVIDGVGESVHMSGSSQVKVGIWGDLPVMKAGDAEALLLSATARRRETDQTPAQVNTLLSGLAGGSWGELLPTFAAAGWTSPEVLVAASDALGFRQLYHASGPGWAAVSTSTRPLANALRPQLDPEALAIQSQLGWQVGQRTPFRGIHKLAAGSALTLSAGAAEASRIDLERDTSAIATGVAVLEASQILRTYLEAYLEDHPDAILQLTGGLDSRILLSAIKPSRRRGLRTMTLAVPGVPDLAIAAELSHRYGMLHEVLTLDGLDLLDHDRAYQLCVDAAHHLDGQADPLAHASLGFAEARSDGGPRLSGLGGEVARGFYYAGRNPDAVTTRRRADRLTAWRMFVNERVSTEAMDPTFAAWASEFSSSEVFRILNDTGKSWLSATDELYLSHRMQRWAGVTETAVCLTRPVINPMLDDRFIAIANRVSPVDKRNARFLSRIQVALDPELAAIPLDERPPPIAYSRPSLSNSTRMGLSSAKKFGRKARQRLRHTNRPPAGAEILAAKVVEHWQANPSLLDGLDGLGVFHRPWLETFLASGTVPTTSTVAFMLNLLVAQDARTASAQ